MDRNYTWETIPHEAEVEEPHSSLTEAGPLIDSESSDSENMKKHRQPIQLKNHNRFGCPYWITLNRNLRCLVIFAIVIFLYLIFHSLSSNHSSYKDYEEEDDKQNSDKVSLSQSQLKVYYKSPKHRNLKDSAPYKFSLPNHPNSRYEEKCFPKERQLGKSIPDIYEKLQLMKGSKISECKTIWDLFDRMFRFDRIDAPIVLPEVFQPEVKGWLGNDSKLFEQVTHQQVYKIVNKYSFEESVFNPLRSKRPTSKSLLDPLVYISNLTESSKLNCDFCKFENHTATDTFGRVVNKFTATASNTFKLAKYHGLFFPKTHHPIDIPYEVILELFVNTSKQWFEKAHREDDVQRYPSLLWDILPHAGASQVHPHIHGILDSHQYAGAFEKSHDISQQYYKQYDSSYWTDLIQVHSALGLGLSFGKAAVIVPLFARKDHELMIFSPVVNEDFAKLIFSILDAYKSNLQVYCFSSGGAYPFMGNPLNDIDRYAKPGLPAMFRFGSRGVCTSISSDVSSLELYTVNNINSDIAATFQAINSSIISFLKTL